MAMAPLRRFSSLAALLLVVLLVAAPLLSSLSAAASPVFEGFDSDELAEEEELDVPSPSLPPPATPLSASPPSDPTPTPPVSVPSTASPLDLWDEDEFEGIPVLDSNPSADPTPETPSDSIPTLDANTSPNPPSPTSRSSYSIEIACVAFLICFAINFFIGRRENERLALSWASRFATKDSIFDKNFSLLGTGDGKDTPLLLKEGQDVFKFWASGRRYCKGLLATIELRSRHDLISRIMDLVFAKKDTVTIEVMINDEAMDHVVLAVARKKAAKAMHKEARDLQRFASTGVMPATGRKWVAEELGVVAESKEVAGDMITDAVLDQVFGEKAFEKFGKGFISLHFTDQHPGSHKKMLIFKFALPGADNMADMTRLIALVPYYIDLIGRYKLSSQAHTKTDAARSKAAQEAFRELQNARQEALAKKKAEKRKSMEEADAKLSAEAIRRRDEKERARQLKKAMPKAKMLRSR